MVKLLSSLLLLLIMEPLLVQLGLTEQRLDEASEGGKGI